MYLASRWLFRNLTRLELVVAWIVILLLIGGFTRYTFLVFARAEQSMVNRTVTNIDTALKYHFGMAAMQNNLETLERLKGMNPMDILQGIEDDSYLNRETLDTVEIASGYPFRSRPSNYGGVISSADRGQLETGHWYFDEQENVLVYLVRSTEFFRSNMVGPDRMRFRMVIDYNDVNANNEFDPGVDEYRSVGMHKLDEFEWAT